MAVLAAAGEEEDEEEEEEGVDMGKRKRVCTRKS